MKVLVIGSGGREHAIIDKLSLSPLISKLYCAPGNGGINKQAQCVDIKATDVEGIVAFSVKEGMDFVVVTPDDPLMLGMVDALEKAGIQTFGPKKNAAIIEGSKVFAKELMKKYNIPTASYEVFSNEAAAIDYVQKRNSYPAVIKADGLALGKGVIIAKDFDEAKKAINDIMGNRIFGDAGSNVVIEEFLTGTEVSILAFTDSKTIVPMVSSQDHKRAYDGDMGPNTGGMGTFSPSRIYNDSLAGECMKKIFKPTIDAMVKEGRPFKGCLYFGLIITDEGPKVIEYNSRFGDPETQVVLPRLKSDLMEIFLAVYNDKLSQVSIEWEDNAAVCVVLASGGYPGKYKTGYEIFGIDTASKLDGIKVFHAGTKISDGKLVTSGGRVLGVTGIGDNLDNAIQKAYNAVKLIDFTDKQYRTDIGIKK